MQAQVARTAGIRPEPVGGTDAPRDCDVGRYRAAPRQRRMSVRLAEHTNR
jgi:hypothetical protein